MSRPAHSRSHAPVRSTKKDTQIETATELTRLPGLEVKEAEPEPARKRANWLEHAPRKRLMVVAGSSHPELAARIADQLGVDLGQRDISTFADGTTYCRFSESVRGADMFIVQTAAGPVDHHLMELLIMVNAAKLASAKRITAVVPWYFYARQDKKSRPREPITARLVADMLETAGVDRVLTMDLHAGQVQGFFNKPVDHMTAVPMFAQHVRDLLGDDEERVAVAPDAGRAKLAGKFAEMIGGDLVVLNKERPAHNVARVTDVIGDVAGKTAVMTDDIIDTAGTLCAGAAALKESGATRVIACATHALFNGDALERIQNSVFDRVVVTDTVPINPLTKPDNLEVLSVSGILAETIHNVFSDDSVSAIFAGENQLF
jgi:ribose-phosphate pyrophosphokinase